MITKKNEWFAITVISNASWGNTWFDRDEQLNNVYAVIMMYTYSIIWCVRPVNSTNHSACNGVYALAFITIGTFEAYSVYTSVESAT